MTFAEVQRAIEREEIELWFQPIVSLRDLSVVRFEGLARWRHPVHGVLGPGDFIGHALSDPLRGAFNQLALRQAIVFAQETSAWADVRIAVNLAGDAFTEPGLPAQIRALLDQHDVAPSRIAIEITETNAIHYAQVDVVLNELADMGISLSVDDFGTGFSSFANVRHIPVNTLKIDTSFVLTMDEVPEDAIIVESVCNLGHSLHMDVVAEGIERVEQLEMLRDINCAYGQGFLFSPAVPSDQAIEMLQNRETASPSATRTPTRGQPLEVRLDTDLREMEHIVADPDCRLQLGLNVLDLVPIAVFLKSTAGHFVWSNRYHFEGSLARATVNQPSARDVHSASEARSFRDDDLRVLLTGSPLIGHREPCTLAVVGLVELTTTKLAVRNSSDEIVGLLGFCSDDNSATMLSALYGDLATADT